MPRRLQFRSPASLTAAASSLLLCACTVVGPDFKRPEVPWLADWQPPSQTAPTTTPPPERRAPDDAWWRHFNDPALDQLVAEAQRLNPCVRTAGMRIMEARAPLGIAGSVAVAVPRLASSGIVLSSGAMATSCAPWWLV